MVLINCAECGHQVSSRAESCPQCGFPLSKARARAPVAAPPAAPSAPRHRWTVVVGVLVAFAASSWLPALSLAVGVAVLALCAAALIPGPIRWARRFLRIESGSVWRTLRRLSAYGAAGALLTLAGLGGLLAEAERLRAALDLERAHASVEALVQDAERAWLAEDPTMARSLIDEALATPGAKDFHSALDLQQRMADAEARAGLAQAEDLLRREDLQAAKARLALAHEVEFVGHEVLGEVEDLQGAIEFATDPDAIAAAFLEVPAPEFEAFGAGRLLPPELSTGIEALDRRVVEQASQDLARITEAREMFQRELAKRQREAAEAAARAQEAERVRQLAEAEAERKNARTRTIEKLFSPWDGSHRGLTRRIKESMNDPRSYEHVKTVYWDRGSYLEVKTTFRGKNGFGGVVPGWVRAKIDLEGNVLTILSQGR